MTQANRNNLFYLVVELYRKIKMYSASHMLSKVRTNPVYNKIGEKNRNYYRNIYLQSDHWKNLRKEKLEKTPYCEKCNRDYCLDVHHLQYKNLFDVVIDDLQTLCRICHNQEHLKKNERVEKRKIPKRSKESIARDDLWLIFNDKKPNILLIKWILKWILRYNQGLKPKKTHFSARNLERQKEFDRNYKHISPMNNYISIHY
jgi:hypothetical protein